VNHFFHAFDIILIKYINLKGLTDISN